MSAITGLTELIYHAAGIGGGMTGTQISEAIRSVRAEAWDEAIDEARERLMMMGCDEDELKAANPYRDK